MRCSRYRLRSGSGFFEIVMKLSESRYHRATQAAESARRRQRLLVWLERFELLSHTPARNPIEADAKQAALEAHLEARPEG